MIALIDDPQLARHLENLRVLRPGYLTVLYSTAETLAGQEREAARATVTQGNVVRGPWKARGKAAKHV